MVWARHRYDQDTLGPYSLRSSSGAITSPLAASGEQFTVLGQPLRVHGMSFHAQSAGAMYCSATASVIDAMLDALADRGINALSIMEVDQYGGNTVSGLPAGCWTSSSYTAYQESFWRGDGTAAGFDYFCNAAKQRGMYIALRFDQWGNVLTGAGFTMPRLGGSYVSTTQKFHGCWWMDGTYGPNIKAAIKAHIATFLNRVNSITGIRYGDDPSIAVVNPLNELGIGTFYWSTSSTTSPSSFTFDKLVANTSADAIHTTYVQAFDAKYTAWHNANFGTDPTWNGVSSTVLPCFAFTGAEGGTVPARPAPKSFRANYTTDGAASNAQRTERMRVAQFIEELERDFHSELRTYLRTLAPNILYSAGQGGWVGAYAHDVSDLVDGHCYHTPFVGSSTSNGNYSLITGSSWTWGAGTLSGTLGSAPDGAHALTIGMPVRVVAHASFETNTTYYWQPGQTFSVGMFCITEGNNVYRCASITTGVTGSTSAGPTGTGTGITDGGVTWDYVWSAIVTIVTTGTTTTFTGTSADPGASLSGVVILPGQSAAICALHATPAADTGTTRISANVNGTTGNVDVAGGLQGDNTTLGYFYVDVFRRQTSYYGKPRFCTEMGQQGGPGVISHVQHPVLYSIWDKLQGGNGRFWFCIANHQAMVAPGDHTLQSHGSAWLLMELLTLMDRYGQIPAFATEDRNTIQASDLYDWYAKHTATADASYAYTGLPGYSTCTDFTHGTQSGQDSNYHSFALRRLRYVLGASTSKSSWAPASITATGMTLSELTDPATCKVYYHRNTGYLTVETPYLCLAVGRIPGTGLNQMSKLNISVLDQTHWYGLVAWVSSNGIALGATGGTSRVYTMMYPRGEGQQFAAISRTAANQGFCSTLDQQGGFSQTDASISPGVELRNGLELQLTSAVQLGAKRLVRGTVQDIYAGYRSGAVHLQPREPRIFLE